MEIHNENIQRQFNLRATGFDRSVVWVTDPGLIAAHVKMAGPPNGKALELCCGTGAVSRGLKAAGWNVLGVDISASMIEQAQQYIPAQVGDVAKLDFEAASFDLVIMRQAYFLLDDGPKSLKEIARILKPGGRFILSHLVPFSDIDADYLREVHTVKQAQMREFHTTQSLTRELVTNGFKVLGQDTAVVRESVTQWMTEAPELSAAQRARVCDMVLNAPPAYSKLRQVQMVGGEIREDWNFVLLLASPV